MQSCFDPHLRTSAAGTGRQPGRADCPVRDGHCGQAQVPAGGGVNRPHHLPGQQAGGGTGVGEGTLGGVRGEVQEGGKDGR